MNTKLPFLFLWLLFVSPTIQAQFNFVTNNGAINITYYSGTNPVVVIPASTNTYPVTIISGFGYSSITSVSIPSSVTNIASYGFEYCPQLTSITIPNTVQMIGEDAFSSCASLANVTIEGGGSTTIAVGAFFGCAKLNNLVLPNGVISIQDNAFWECGLTNVTIPDTVTNLGVSPFYACPNLTNISVNSQNTFFSSLNGVLFDKNEQILIEYPAGRVGNYAIPGTVTEIADSAFDCRF